MRDKVSCSGTICYRVQILFADFGTTSSLPPECFCTQVFTCLATLSILDALPLQSDGSSASASSAQKLDLARTGAWLCERQLPNGGLNGRPQKLEDVCYSWWVLSSLSMVHKLHWINAKKLRAFILDAQVSRAARMIEL